MKNKFVKLLIFVVILFLGLFICSNTKEKHYLKDILINTEATKGYITKYTVYGKHLNIEGKIDIENSDLKLVLINNKKEKTTFDLITELKDGLNFTLSDKINEGINLEELENGKYVVLLEANNKYYHLMNQTEYPSLTYYTVTKKRHNNKIQIDFKNHYEKDYFSIDVNRTNDKNFYDIIIDAGHGGIDTGASTKSDYESTYTLDYALALKESLTNLGLKVKLTRDEDKHIKPYGESGRATMSYEVKAKMIISIHLNSSEVNRYRGFEIYKANRTNNTFSKILSNNILNMTSMPYSNLPTMKVDNGIYIKTFKQEDIKTSKIEAKKYGYNPYNINEDTNYLYMIRETGGIMTGSYIDGRDKNTEKNPYYNVNYGSEAYLLELGYIINNKDLKIIKTEKDNYVEAIKKSIKEYLNV